MNRILAYAVDLIDRARVLFSRVFDVVDDTITELTLVIDTYGPTLLEYVYTTAVKLERAIPSHGFGSTKAAMLDSILAEQAIPALERLRGKHLSTAAKSALDEYAKRKLAEFVAERNSNGDWQQYIDDLDTVERELFSR